THSYRTSARRLRTSVAASRPTVVCITAHCMGGAWLQALLAMYTHINFNLFHKKQKLLTPLMQQLLFLII
ncbi:MAG: hypothetical protein MRZ66_06505, partial [Clostridiales bacterium]|nr:hypothetical protein [Clostridiales bacterium]